MNEADFPNEDIESDLEKLTWPAPVLIQGLKTKNSGSVYWLEEVVVYVLELTMW